MSLQWTVIATFLYIEIFVVLLLVLPVASPKRWQRLFKSRFLQSLTNQASVYFLVLLAILVLFLLDAIREMRKYSTTEVGDHQHLNLEMQGKYSPFNFALIFEISFCSGAVICKMEETKFPKRFHFPLLLKFQVT